MTFAQGLTKDIYYNHGDDGNSENSDEEPDHDVSGGG
jgi:hypothetical protein